MTEAGEMRQGILAALESANSERLAAIVAEVQALPITHRLAHLADLKAQQEALTESLAALGPEVKKARGKALAAHDQARLAKEQAFAVSRDAKALENREHSARSSLAQVGREIDRILAEIERQVDLLGAPVVRSLWQSRQWGSE